MLADLGHVKRSFQVSDGWTGAGADADACPRHLPALDADYAAITADLAFLGADGLTLEGGATTANVLIAEVDRRMVERARTQACAGGCTGHESCR